MTEKKNAKAEAEVEEEGEEGDDDSVAIYAFGITLTAGGSTMVWTDETPDEVAKRYETEIGKARGGAHRLMRFPPLLTKDQKKAKREGDEDVDQTPEPLTEIVPKVVSGRIVWRECPICNAVAGAPCTGLPAGTPEGEVHAERRAVPVEVTRPIKFVRVDLIAGIETIEDDSLSLLGDDDEDEDEGDEGDEDPDLLGDDPQGAEDDSPLADGVPVEPAAAPAARRALPAGFAPAPK